MKSTILLTTALFLASAPSPDAQTISELSAGFLSVDNDYGLMASEDSVNGRFDPRNPAELESFTINTIEQPASYKVDPAERGIAASQERVQIN